MSCLQESIKHFFFAICMSAVLTMICLEIVRYTKNDDASIISFKRFNASPKDKYPSFTLCFQTGEAKGEAIFDVNQLGAISDIRPLRYWKLITGKINTTVDEVKQLSYFSNVTIKMQNLVRQLYTIGDDLKKSNKWALKKVHAKPSAGNPLISDSSSSSWPFYVSYQNPDKICFTRSVSYKKDEVKLKDGVILDSQVLDELHGSGYLYLYVHYPHHTIRSFGEEVAFLLLTKKSGDINKTLRIKISGVNVIRKRIDANSPCDSSVDDQDSYFRSEVIQKLGCIPPYWKSLIDSNHSPLSLCVSSIKLRDAYKYAQRMILRREIYSKSEPCTEMSVSSSIEAKTNKSNLILVFHYRAKNYMDTTNTRAYVVGDLVSSAGGFVGMFLGFGLFQLPEIFSSFSNSIKKFCRNQ